jgi:hypothetical protein
MRKNNPNQWMVMFKKDQEAFILRFTSMDDMLIATYRARGAGYKIKTLPIKGRFASHR